ncbi:MAG: VTT domain-containing protein [Opitutaceae bacterium]
MRFSKSTGVCGACLVILLAIALYAGSWAFDLRGGIARTVVVFRDAGAWPFFTAMAVLPALGFPISAFNVVAGPVFGPALGVGTVIACAGLAITANLAGSYWVANRALRPLMERWVKRLGYAVPELPAGSAWEITLVVRIIPGPPLFLQSYLLALARVPFGTYMLISLAVQMTFLTTVILAGDAVARGDWRAMTAAGVLFVLVGAVMHRLRARFAAARRLRETRVDSAAAG